MTKSLYGFFVSAPLRCEIRTYYGGNLKAFLWTRGATTNLKPSKKPNQAKSGLTRFGNILLSESSTLKQGKQVLLLLEVTVPHFISTLL